MAHLILTCKIDLESLIMRDQAKVLNAMADLEDLSLKKKLKFDLRSEDDTYKPAWIPAERPKLLDEGWDEAQKPQTAVALETPAIFAVPSPPVVVQTVQPVEAVKPVEAVTAVEPAKTPAKRQTLTLPKAKAAKAAKAQQPNLETANALLKEKPAEAAQPAQPAPMPDNAPQPQVNMGEAIPLDSAETKILKALQGMKKGTFQQLQEATGLVTGTLSPNLSRMVLAGKIEKHSPAGVTGRTTRDQIDYTISRQQRR